jgi:hypothetical protein
MDKGVAAAKRRFPERAQAIECRAARDEDFRELCRDLAEAETELQRWQTSTAAESPQWRDDYARLVEALAGEIYAAINSAKVLRFNRLTPRGPN